MILITVHPESVAKALLNSVDLVLAVGAVAGADDRGLLRGRRRTPRPSRSDARSSRGEVLAVVAAIGGTAGPGPVHSASIAAAPAFAQVRRGQPGAGAELPLPRPRGQAQPPRPEPEPVSPDRRRRRRRDLDASPPPGRLFGMVPPANQGCRPRRRSGTGRAAAGRYAPQDSRAAIREAVERRYTLPSEPAEFARPTPVSRRGPDVFRGRRSGKPGPPL